MAEEAGVFGFGDVVEDIADKMVRRHPHVFGDESRDKTAGEQTQDWERIKAAGAGRLGGGGAGGGRRGAAGADPGGQAAEPGGARRV